MSCAAVSRVFTPVSAAQLHRKRWPLVPLEPGTKRPARGRTDWINRPLTLAEAEQWPGDVGVIHRDDLLILDFDVKSGGLETLAEWRNRFTGVFDKPLQKTRSGGFHFAWRLPEGFDASTLPIHRTAIAPGVDLPVHVVVYADLHHRGDLAEAPAELVVFLQSFGTGKSSSQNTTPGTAPSFELIAKAVRDGIPNTESTSRDEWVRMAHLIKGACGFEYEDQGLELFQVWASGYPENDPAENERAYTTAKPKAGWHALRELADRHGLSLQLEEAVAAFAAAPLPVSEPTDPPAFVWMREYLANPDLLKPPVALIPRLAWPKRVTLVAGLPKSGKSTWVSDGVAEMTRGESFLGESTTPATVLWYCLDEPAEDLVRRLAEYGADPDRIAIVTTRHRPDQIEELTRQIGASVIVLDTLARYATGTVTKPGDPHQWTALLQPLVDVARRTGAAMVWLHHNKKASGEVRDSTAIEAEADVILAFQPHSRGETRRDVYTKGRLPLKDFQLDHRAGRYVLVTEGASAVGATDGGTDWRRWKVLESLVQAAEPLTTAEWQRAAEDRAGLRKTAFYDARGALLADEYVAKEGKSRRTCKWVPTPVGIRAMREHWGEEIRQDKDLWQAEPSTSASSASSAAEVEENLRISASSGHIEYVPDGRTDERTNGQNPPPADLMEDGEAVEAVPVTPEELQGLQAIESGRAVRFRNAIVHPLTPEELAAYRQSEEPKRPRGRRKVRELGE